MARMDRECPACGKTLLSIATRCPGCGEELPPRLAAERPGMTIGISGTTVTVVVAVALLGLSVLTLGRSGAREREVAPTPAPRAERSAPLGTTSSAGTAVVPGSAPGNDAVLRVAATWTNVRSRRSPHADVVAVLLPGDTVRADSLRGGWWRVALDGRVLGYSYTGALAAP